LLLESRKCNISRFNIIPRSSPVAVGNRKEQRIQHIYKKGMQTEIVVNRLLIVHAFSKAASENIKIATVNNQPSTEENRVLVFI
jgi:hypothetical protein